MNSLGVYTQTTDSCADGGDFRCGPKGGIVSCRPCDIAQLAVFKQLQRALNRLMTALRVQLPAPLRDGDGKSLVWIDGRIGPKTATATGLVAAALGNGMSASLAKALKPFLDQGATATGMSIVAAHAKELADFLTSPSR